jgi:uncharacterized phosphosugar-binding protein
MLGDDYHREITRIIEDIHGNERGTIEAAAKMIAETIEHGGVVHAFGPGHSAMIAKEITTRAGGLVPVNQIVDPADGIAERLPGYAATLLAPYSAQYDLRPGETLIVISNSGINPLPIELAVAARERGLHVVCLTNVTQSRGATSRHPSGKRLFEVVDVVLDTHAVVGDAAVELPGLGQRSGATSTIAGAYLINLLMLRSIELLQERAFEPPVLVSQNLPGADARNEQLFTAYRARVRRPGA